MSTLLDIVHRAIPARPWAEGDNIPWNEPAFSERMLAEHLSQAHDAASRRTDKIDEHVAWIHSDLLGGEPTRILDLGCGPGLYTSRLARLGHACVGIDFSPASIDYARQEARRDGLACEYALADLREADFGRPFGLVMLLFGQLNVFRRSEAASLLRKVRGALEPGGILLLEPQRFETIQTQGERPPTWSACEAGLFSERPHVLLEESFWDADAQTGTQRWYVVDAETGEATRHALSNEAYTDEQYRDLLSVAGFDDLRFLPSLIGRDDESQSFNHVIVAR